MQIPGRVFKSYAVERGSFDALQGHLFELVGKLFHPVLCWLIYHQSFQTILLVSVPDPPHNGSRHNEAFLVW